MSNLQEVLATKEQLRTGEFTYYDRVLERWEWFGFLNYTLLHELWYSEINQAIIQTDENYENMMFREGLKTGGFELQVCRICPFL